MAEVRLNADDVEGLSAAQQILLSPLNHAAPAEWQLRCNHAIRALKVNSRASPPGATPRNKSPFPARSEP